MNTSELCPFSKPIIGKWCQCPYASLADRCSGKMLCTRAADYRESCVALSQVLKEKSRFVLGLPADDMELTHAQSMKIRCGGLLGMQRVLEMDMGVPPVVRDVISAVEAKYRELSNFPFNEIVRDIKTFRHRK